ncbi:ATPase, T2SS/T4P/T4SS family [Comamonas testosteroni]|jgi:Tfp pilus assembly pilus retraction ATPase PilT|uniref:ATPase, T2SS/T4P/T4SS family n=1 Tax=Comamonas testosteroni TaxID=285 RepID=UPI0026EFAC7D|nr:ATPase, T2SS/T4P/T4SS family [Comamonas testosteroni]
MILSLEFSDLYVGEKPDLCWYKRTPDSMTVVPLPASMHEEVAQLFEFLKAQAKSFGTNFRVNWPLRAPNAEQLRCALMTLGSQKKMFVCRRFNLIANNLKTLGVPLSFAQQLTSSELKEGLVIFMGKAGSGKTTTASAFTMERLTLHGGVCWTAENPIEIPMEGKHGNGWCYQTQVTSDDGIGPAIREMLRASPNIIYIGELRDSLAVQEAITAGISGHLVVATFHASDLINGLVRLSMLAKDEMISAALADSLRAAVHLSLHIHDPSKAPPAGSLPESRGTGTPPRVLSVSPLWATGEHGDGLKTIIRDKSFHLLKSEVERQLRQAQMARVLI